MENQQIDNGHLFDKTTVPVRLILINDKDTLITRSQAKRLLMGLDRFRLVVFDFEGVHKIGQAFADEIFRVFHNEYPQIEIVKTNTTEQIRQMINRAENMI